MAETPNPEQLKDKLQRALKAKAVLQEKARLLNQQVEDSRKREDTHSHFISELLDRQRETNFMLHRANSVLHRLQETNLALSSEFSSLVKELPAPNSPDWEQRVAKINDLFRKTGELADEIHDEVFRSHASDEPQKPAASAPKVEVPPASEVVQSASQPVQPAVEATTPEPADAVLVVNADAPAVEPEQPLQPVVDEPTLDADYTTEEAERQERLDRLFRRLDAVDTASDDDTNEEDPAPQAKSGVFSRFWGKVKGHHPQDDSAENRKVS